MDVVKELPFEAQALLAVSVVLATVLVLTLARARRPRTVCRLPRPRYPRVTEI